MNIQELTGVIAKKWEIPADSIIVTPKVLDGKLSFDFEVYQDKIDLELASDKFKSILKNCTESGESPKTTEIFPDGVNLDCFGNFSVGGAGTDPELVEELLEALHACCHTNKAALALIGELEQTLFS